MEVPLLSLEEAYAIKNIDVLGFKTITIDCTMPYADAKTPPGRQVTHTSAYVSIRLHTSAYVSIRLHTSAYVSMRH